MLYQFRFSFRIRQRSCNLLFFYYSVFSSLLPYIWLIIELDHFKNEQKKVYNLKFLPIILDISICLLFFYGVSTC